MLVFSRPQGSFVICFRNKKKGDPFETGSQSVGHISGMYWHSANVVVILCSALGVRETSNPLVSSPRAVHGKV
jgi:hypothetical protein